jgi:hypothetical protein
MASDAERLARCYRYLFRSEMEDLDFVPAYLSTMGQCDLLWEIEQLEAI